MRPMLVKFPLSRSFGICKALNTRARNLYQRLGYEEIGIVESNFNGIPNVRLVCLEKTEINL